MLDVIGALVDAGDASTAVELLNGKIVEIAVAAERAAGDIRRKSASQASLKALTGGDRVTIVATWSDTFTVNMAGPAC